MSLLVEIATAVAKGKVAAAKENTQRALDEGLPAKDILEQGLMVGLMEIGERFKKNDAFIPEVLISAKAMNQSMEILKPLLAGEVQQKLGTVILGTVQGDVHDIGKNIVAMLLQGNGFEVIDLGINVPNETFVKKVKEKKAAILAMSALLSTTLPYLGQVIEELEKAGIRDQVKVMVGGAPVTKAYSEKIGADGYSVDAAGAVDVAKSFISTGA